MFRRGAGKGAGRLATCLWLGALVTGFVSGCSQRGPDLAPVEAAFEIVTNTNRYLLDRALQQTRAGDYSGALASLDELERRYRLTPEQELAVHTLRRDLRRRAPAEAPAAPSTGAVTRPGR